MARKLIGSAILALLVLVCTYLFLHSSFFNVEKIYVTGLKQVSEQEVLHISELSPGVNIFEVNNRICAKSIEIHPMIKHASVIRHLPRTIELKVQEREIWALIPYNDIVLCIDDDGFCIDKKANFSLINYPIITMDILPARINLGQAVESDGVKMIREVWNVLTPEMKEAISEFHYVNEKKEIIIYTAEGTEVRFGTSDRLTDKVAFLEQVFKIEKEFKQKGSDVLEYVDLRFKGQPVVKTKV